MSIKIKKHEGILDFVNTEYRLWKHDKLIEKRSAIDDSLISEVAIGNDLGFIYADKEVAYYHVIDFDESDFLCWRFGNPDLLKVSSHSAFCLYLFHQYLETLYFYDSGSGNIYTFNTKDNLFSLLINIPYPNELHVSRDSLVSIGIGSSSVIECHDLKGTTKWSIQIDNNNLSVIDAAYHSGCEIQPCSGTYNDNILITINQCHLLSLDVGTGDLNWVLPDILDKQWIIGNEGKVYSVFKGNLKVVDAESGELLFDKSIKADWVQAEKDTLNLFQINVSSTHLWCGFLGHGLCAVNLETAEIDWHEFDGQSLNRKPIIKNNRIYVQLMSGGIGLDNEGTQEYILEGEGGYIEDSDNEFIVF